MSKIKKRYWWLIDMIHENGFTIGAEIGCANGATTHRVLRYCKQLRLYAVDKWEKIDGSLPEAGQVGMENWDPKKGFIRFSSVTMPYQDRLTVLRGDSVKMAEKVEDGSLDFVFIDADHRYDAVRGDIIAWSAKVRKGGIVCGHDFKPSRFPGVVRAVHELFTDYKEEGNTVWSAKREDYVD